MGTLSEELAVTILRNFNLAQITVTAQWEADLAARMDKPPTWSWTPGTFVFPEGLCCYCGGVMRSPAIWRTDNLQFLGSWKVVGDGGGVGHFEFDDEHPHVNDGSICMGGDGYRATSVADALFLAFNPLSMYFGGDAAEGTTAEEELKAWFADRFDHRCGEATNIATIDGIDIRHVVAPEEGCHCQHCRRHRGEVRCHRETCGQWYAPNVGHGRFKCETCDRSLTRRFCIKHKHDQHRCVNCRDTHDLYDTELGAMRANPEIKQCGECGEWVCIYCLGEPEGYAPEHGCVRDGDEEDDEDTAEHVCCGCSECCECGVARTCEGCGNSVYSCECDTDEDDTEEEF